MGVRAYLRGSLDPLIHRSSPDACTQTRTLRATPKPLWLKPLLPKAGLLSAPCTFLGADRGPGEQKEQHQGQEQQDQGPHGPSNRERGYQPYCLPRWQQCGLSQRPGVRRLRGDRLPVAPRRGLGPWWDRLARRPLAGGIWARALAAFNALSTSSTQRTPPRGVETLVALRSHSLDCCCLCDRGLRVWL